MNTTDISILKSFSGIVNREKLSEELYNELLKCWNLDKINLEDEYIKIQMKKSSLTKSRRDAVPEFIRIKNLIKEKQELENESIVMENNVSDTLITGGDFSDEIITNQEQVESNAENC